ncbi:glycosyltransferase [Candidatus Contendibacter odensensis]|uniref:Glycosyl transferase group 1 n=1 Tax=Candidatus Contendobacter odensis Run_B_J11 TaxID=1400861 RepID=A0A7U7J669_9GAMM|nr:glycosyltransferase [Candidatus Contendobacter odensis]MBK8751412.1 glycosyltransferase [Candidatus Competibacteraceae bacterium]CDH47312.1 Glycosyl transferase group 1 [Candidatus Contendobacter odensis Run_B_J11]
MKILMLSDVYFPRVNGVSTSIQTFRCELQRLGHEIWVVAPDYGQPTADEDRICRVPSRQVLLDPEDRMMRPNLLSRRLAELRAHQFDIVHIQTPFVAHYAGVRLAQQWGVPCVETYHTFFEEYLFHYLPVLPKRGWRAVARLLSRRQCNQLNGLVVPSQAMREVLVQYGVRTSMRVIPTGMPLESFQEGDGAAFRSRHNIAIGQPTLVFVGRVAFEKNIEFLLHVVRELQQTTHPDLVLIIAGEGPAETSLRRLGTTLGLEANLRFVRYLARGVELSSCYQAGDVFVFASRTETQGLVLLEAMSLGVPVVSTAVMGTRDILAANQGALVAEENVAGFATQVRRVLDDAELRRRLCAEGRIYARQWAAEGPAQALLAFYADLRAGRVTDSNAQEFSKR